MAEHPSRNLFVRLNVYLPWDTVKVGESFFIKGATAEQDTAAIRQTATRKGFRVSIRETTEADGTGVRVKRTA